MLQERAPVRFHQSEDEGPSLFALASRASLLTIPLAIGRVRPFQHYSGQPTAFGAGLWPGIAQSSATSSIAWTFSSRQPPTIVCLTLFASPAAYVPRYCFAAQDAYEPCVDGCEGSRLAQHDTLRKCEVREILSGPNIGLA